MVGWKEEGKDRWKERWTDGWKGGNMVKKMDEERREVEWEGGKDR